MGTARVLFEREPQLDLLAGLLTEVPMSGGRVVLVRGEAGIGKTALVKEFLRRVADRAHVLFGSCDDLLTARPLGPFWDMARRERSLAGALAKGDRSNVMEAAFDLVERSLRPTVLVIDDTHWADAATLDVISYLGRRIDRTNGLMVITYRDGEVDTEHPLRAVIGSLLPEVVVRIRLGGLSLDAVSQLVAPRGLDPGEVFAATDGNPFLVTEMASAETTGVPGSVKDSVTARVRKLSLEAQQMLKLLSVIPERVPRSEALTLGGRDEDWLHECERRGLLDVGRNSIRFRHELIRRAVEASLSTTERVALNRTVLDSLPPETDPARLVHHAYEGNDVERLIQLAPEAARAAVAVGSHREALDHYRRLKPFLDRIDTEAIGPILEEWAGQESSAGHDDEALRLNELALAHHRKLGDRAGQSRALADRAYYSEMLRERERAEEFARQAVEVLGPESDGTDLARALEAGALLALLADNPAEVLRLVDRIFEVAGPEIDEELAVRCLVHKGAAENIARYPAGSDSLEEAGFRAEALGNGRELYRSLINVADPAVDHRDLNAAKEYARRAISVNVRYQRGGAETYSKACLARALELTGEWIEAEDLTSDVHDPRSVQEMIAFGVSSRIQSRRGRPGASKGIKAAWQLALATDEFERIAPAAAGLAEHCWITGDSDVPISEVRDWMEAGLHLYDGWPSASIALWLWKLGELPQLPGEVPKPYRLLFEREPGEAAERFAELGMPYERAIALTHGNESQRLEALDVLEELGATAVSKKLRRELRRQGVSLPRRRRKAESPDALTARQAEVLALLADGLSNAEIADHLFLSPRTVEHHVAAIMSKLNASSRREAVDLAGDAGLLRPLAEPPRADARVSTP